MSAIERYESSWSAEIADRLGGLRQRSEATSSFQRQAEEGGSEGDVETVLV